MTRRPPNKDVFYNALRSGVQRVCNRTSPREVAFAVDLSKKQLGNLLTGSETSAKVPFDLLGIDPTALDDIAALYDVEIVPAAPEADAGELLVLLTTLAAAVAGTPKLTHQDLLKHEALIRETVATLKAALAKCRSIRGASR